MHRDTRHFLRGQQAVVLFQPRRHFRSRYRQAKFSPHRRGAGILLCFLPKVSVRRLLGMWIFTLYHRGPGTSSTLGTRRIRSVSRTPLTATSTARGSPEESKASLSWLLQRKNTVLVKVSGRLLKALLSFVPTLYPGVSWQRGSTWRGSAGSRGASSRCASIPGNGGVDVPPVSPSLPNSKVKDTWALPPSHLAMYGAPKAERRAHAT